MDHLGYSIRRLLSINREGKHPQKDFDGPVIRMSDLDTSHTDSVKSAKCAAIIKKEKIKTPKSKKPTTKEKHAKLLEATEENQTKSEETMKLTEELNEIDLRRFVEDLAESQQIPNEANVSISLTQNINFEDYFNVEMESFRYLFGDNQNQKKNVSTFKTVDEERDYQRTTSIDDSKNDDVIEEMNVNIPCRSNEEHQMLDFKHEVLDGKFEENCDDLRYQHWRSLHQEGDSSNTTNMHDSKNQSGQERTIKKMPKLDELKQWKENQNQIIEEHSTNIKTNKHDFSQERTIKYTSNSRNEDQHFAEDRKNIDIDIDRQSNELIICKLPPHEDRNKTKSNPRSDTEKHSPTSKAPKEDQHEITSNNSLEATRNNYISEDKASHSSIENQFIQIEEATSNGNEDSLTIFNYEQRNVIRQCADGEIQHFPVGEKNSLTIQKHSKKEIITFNSRPDGNSEAVRVVKVKVSLPKTRKALADGEKVKHKVEVNGNVLEILQIEEDNGKSSSLLNDQYKFKDEDLSSFNDQSKLFFDNCGVSILPSTFTNQHHVKDENCGSENIEKGRNVKEDHDKELRILNDLNPKASKGKFSADGLQTSQGEEITKEDSETLYNNFTDTLKSEHSNLIDFFHNTDTLKFEHTSLIDFFPNTSENTQHQEGINNATPKNITQVSIEYDALIKDNIQSSEKNGQNLCKDTSKVIKRLQTLTNEDASKVHHVDDSSDAFNIRNHTSDQINKLKIPNASTENNIERLKTYHHAQQVEEYVEDDGKLFNTFGEDKPILKKGNASKVNEDSFNTASNVLKVKQNLEEDDDALQLLNPTPNHVNEFNSNHVEEDRVHLFNIITDASKLKENVQVLNILTQASNSEERHGNQLIIITDASKTKHNLEEGLDELQISSFGKDHANLLQIFTDVIDNKQSLDVDGKPIIMFADALKPKPTIKEDVDALKTTHHFSDEEEIITAASTVNDLKSSSPKQIVEEKNTIRECLISNNKDTSAGFDADVMMVSNSDLNIEENIESIDGKKHSISNGEVKKELVNITPEETKETIRKYCTNDTQSVPRNEDLMLKSKKHTETLIDVPKSDKCEENSDENRIGNIPQSSPRGDDDVWNIKKVWVKKYSNNIKPEDHDGKEIADAVIKKRYISDVMQLEGIANTKGLQKKEVDVSTSRIDTDADVVGEESRTRNNSINDVTLPTDHQDIVDANKKIRKKHDVQFMQGSNEDITKKVTERPEKEEVEDIIMNDVRKYNQNKERQDFSRNKDDEEKIKNLWETEQKVKNCNSSEVVMKKNLNVLHNHKLNEENVEGKKTKVDYQSDNLPPVGLHKDHEHYSHSSKVKDVAKKSCIGGVWSSNPEINKEVNEKNTNRFLKSPENNCKNPTSTRSKIVQENTTNSIQNSSNPQKSSPYHEAKKQNFNSRQAYRKECYGRIYQDIMRNPRFKQHKDLIDTFIINDVFKPQTETEPNEDFNLEEERIRRLINRSNNYKPLMGKSALLAKTSLEKNDSEIVQELVMQRFADFLSSYYQRSFRRQNSRLQKSGEDEFDEDGLYEIRSSTPTGFDRSYLRESGEFVRFSLPTEDAVGVKSDEMRSCCECINPACRPSNGCFGFKLKSVNRCCCVGRGGVEERCATRRRNSKSFEEIEGSNYFDRTNEETENQIPCNPENYRSQGNTAMNLQGFPTLERNAMRFEQEQASSWQQKRYSETFVESHHDKQDLDCKVFLDPPTRAPSVDHSSETRGAADSKVLDCKVFLDPATRDPSVDHSSGTRGAADSKVPTKLSSNREQPSHVPNLLRPLLGGKHLSEDFGRKNDTCDQGRSCEAQSRIYLKREDAKTLKRNDPVRKSLRIESREPFENSEESFTDSLEDVRLRKTDKVSNQIGRDDERNHANPRSSDDLGRRFENFKCETKITFERDNPESNFKHTSKTNIKTQHFNSKDVDNSKRTKIVEFPPRSKAFSPSSNSENFSSTTRLDTSIKITSFEPSFQSTLARSTGSVSTKSSKNDLKSPPGNSMNTSSNSLKTPEATSATNRFFRKLVTKKVVNFVTRSPKLGKSPTPSSTSRSESRGGNLDHEGSSGSTVTIKDSFDFDFKIDDINLDFLRSTDEHNVETSEEFLGKDKSEEDAFDDDSDKVSYDAHKFLRDALGDELKTYLSTDSQLISDLDNTGNNSIGTSNISDLLSKASSYGAIQNTQEKTTKRNSTIYEENCYAEYLSNSKKLADLILEANVQNQILAQTNKALTLCRRTKEFAASIEEIEAERILLVATLKREALKEEIQRIEYEDLTDSPYQNSGCVRIKGLTFPPKPRNSFVPNLFDKRRKEFTHWFVAVLKSGASVIATKPAIPDTDGMVKFDEEFIFDQLSPDFTITIAIYVIKIKNNIRNYSHESKFHLNKNGNTLCPSPHKLFNISRDAKAKSQEESVASSSFVLGGRCVIGINNLKDLGYFKLSEMPLCSMLEGTVVINFQTSVTMNETFSDFLNVGAETGEFITWNRRWCTLQGPYLLYFNYPEDEEPVSRLDLSYCITSYVTCAERKICARPRTLLLETAMKGSSEHSPRVIKHFLATDTMHAMKVWESKLNHTVSALRNWNCMKCNIVFNKT